VFYLLLAVVDRINIKLCNRRVIIMVHSGCQCRRNGEFFGEQDAAQAGEFASEKAVASYAPHSTITPTHLGSF
jgi:hypothetical protein